ncbi:MAG: helix-turn-helix domain-containing protein [Prevotella sp.]|nr:helix-turn-helix domain-containing protein [Prevotella sp.]
MEKTRITTSDCRDILSQFGNKREALILVYLLAIADGDGRVNGSINALASQLDMHRQTLARYIYRLCEKGYAVWENTTGSRHPNLLYVSACVQADVTGDVQACVTEDETACVTENVTTPACCDTAAFRYESDKYDNVENPSVTIGVTGYVTSYLTANVATFVTSKEEKKQKKEEFPPAPPIEEKKTKKRKKQPHTRACVREKFDGKT